MRDFLRYTALFLVAVLAMGLAFGAGHATASRLQDAPAEDLPAALAALPGLGRAPAAEPPDEAASEDAAPAQGERANFETYWEAWSEIVGRAYEGAPDDASATYESIRGSLRVLDDPYTLFTDPVINEVQSVELEGEFEGIGAFVQTDEEGRLVIQTPMRGQPAEKAGILAGDIVLEVDGQDISGMDINESVLLIRGPKGTEVLLLVQREGVDEPFEVTVTRDRIDIPSVNDVRLLEEEGAPEVGYLQLTVFAAETRDELVEAIAELREQGARALVLDLRNNPGGYLNAAVGVSSEFLDEGVVTIREDSQGNRREEAVLEGGSALDIPLVVLINQGSASASEIVAGALRDYERAEIVGQTSFGKGSVQNVHELEDGSQLRVTVEIWRTPGGSLIHKRGITPDHIVEPPALALAEEAMEDDDPEAETEDGAEEDATDAGPGLEQPVDPLEEPEEESPPDPQLERAVQLAIELLEGVR